MGEIKLNKKPVISKIIAEYRGGANKFGYERGKRYEVTTRQADEIENLSKGWTLLLLDEQFQLQSAYKTTDAFLMDWYILKVIAQWD